MLYIGMIALKKVYLEIGNICNLSCAFCPGTRRRPRMLSLEEFTLLAQKIRPHAQYLYFHLMGEPLLHPLLGEFLKIAGLRGYSMETARKAFRLYLEQ